MGASLLKPRSTLFQILYQDNKHWKWTLYRLRRALSPLLTKTNRLLRSLRSEKLISVEFASTLLETQLYTQILDEVGTIALSETSSIPESASLCLQLCGRHLGQVEEWLARFHEKKKLGNDDRLSIYDFRDGLIRTLTDFRRFVIVLRDIVMDSLTQQLIQSRQETESGKVHRINLHNQIDTNQKPEVIKEQIDLFIQQLIVMLHENKTVFCLDIHTKFTDQSTSIKRHPEDAVDQLKQAVKDMNIPSGGVPGNINPFQFHAKILHPLGSSDEPANVCAKLDTGSEDNWMSHHLLARLGIEEHREDTVEGKLYIGVEGSVFQPLGKIAVTWTRNSVKSWHTDFLVVETAAFDVIFGRHFIVQESLFVFAEPVLAADVSRLAPLSKEDYQQMEQNIRERGVQNEELAMTREAKDAAARQRRREQKAASRISLASTPGIRTPYPVSHAPFLHTYRENASVGAASTNPSTAPNESVSTEE